MYKDEILLKNYLIKKIESIQEREKLANQIDNFVFEAYFIHRDKKNLSQINEIKAIKNFVNFIKKKFSSPEEMIASARNLIKTRKFRVSSAIINYISLAFSIYSWYLKGELPDIHLYATGAQSVLALLQTVSLIIEKMQVSKDEETKNKLEILNNQIREKTDLNGIKDLSNELGKLEFEDIGSLSR